MINGKKHANICILNKVNIRMIMVHDLGKSWIAGIAFTLFTYTVFYTWSGIHECLTFKEKKNCIW